MGVEVAIGSAAAISKVVISIGQCFWKNFNFKKKKTLFFFFFAWKRELVVKPRFDLF